MTNKKAAFTEQQIAEHEKLLQERLQDLSVMISSIETLRKSQKNIILAAKKDNEITHKDKIAFCRVADFEERMSTSTSKPCNNRNREGWTQENVGVDKSQNEGWTKTRVDTSRKAEEQASLEGWTQENVGVDKNSLGVDKNVHPHIEEGNIYSSLKEEYIISEEKEKSKKKKKNNPSEKISSSISQAKNQKTELTKKSPIAEFSQKTAKTSYAYGGDKVLPQSEDNSTEIVAGNLALAKKQAKPDTTECALTSEQRLAKGENDNSPPLLATFESLEPEQSISEEEHYQIAADIPSLEIELTPPVQEAATAKPEVKSFSADNEESDNAGNVKQTLSCEDEDDAKWQSLRKFVLEKFKRKEELAYGILYNMTITAIRPNRIGISFARDLGFSKTKP